MAKLIIHFYQYLAMIFIHANFIFATGFRK
jgi:hypothetical protein